MLLITCGKGQGFDFSMTKRILDLRGANRSTERSARTGAGETLSVGEENRLLLGFLRRKPVLKGDSPGKRLFMTREGDFNQASKVSHDGGNRFPWRG